jgi:cell wall assembly regulator SMI1
VKPRWGQAFVVLAAAVVFAGGIVVAVLARDEPGAAAEGTFASLRAVPLTGGTYQPKLSVSISVVPRPTPIPRPPLTVDSGCRPGGGSTSQAAVPDPVAERVNLAWQRIETWLAAHAPASSAALAGPAEPGRIAQLQQRIGVTLPPELVASLLRHDGMGTRGGNLLPPLYRLLSVADIGGQAEMLCEVLMRGVNENVGTWWHGQFVPFAVNGGGDSLFLDQRGGHGGKLGEHDHEAFADFSSWPATLTDLLEQTATALETGQRTHVYCRAEVTPAGVLTWELLR